MGIVQSVKDKYVEVAREREYNKQIKKEAHSEYLQEKYKLAKESAKERAQLESKAKLERYKESLKPQSRPRANMANIGAGLMGAAQGAGNFLMGSPPQQQRTMRRTPQKRKKTTKKKRKKTQKRQEPRYRNTYSMF